jgi:hypothetical protein
MEVLTICSYELTKDTKTYQSLWEMNGVQITDLNLIGEDCQLLVCSEMPMMASGTEFKIRVRPNMNISLKEKDANKRR